MHAKSKSSSKTTRIIEATIVTYAKSFLRASTREKRYLTSVNFPFLSSPLQGLNHWLARLASPNYRHHLSSQFLATLFPLNPAACRRRNRTRPSQVVSCCGSRIATTQLGGKQRRISRAGR